MSKSLESQVSVHIKGCLRGVAKAQKDLYAITYRELFHCCTRYVNHIEDAQSVFNLSMLKIYNGLKAFEIGTDYFAWASTIIIRSSINHLRDNSKYNKSVLFLDPGGTQLDKFDINKALSDLETEQILSLIQALPDRERLIFSMYEIDGFSHVEIEQETGIKANTSKWLLASAKSILRQKIQGLYKLKSCSNE